MSDFYPIWKKRTQFVSIGIVSSTIEEILNGVPRGSVLDPIPFLLYLNELHNSAKYARAYHSADDTSILLPGISL